MSTEEAKELTRRLLLREEPIQAVLYPNRMVRVPRANAEVRYSLIMVAEHLDMPLPKRQAELSSMTPVVDDGFTLTVDHYQYRKQVAEVVHGLQQTRANYQKLGITLPMPLDVRIDSRIRHLKEGVEIPSLSREHIRRKLLQGNGVAGMPGVYIRSREMPDDPGYIVLAGASTKTMAHEIGHWLHRNLESVDQSKITRAYQRRFMERSKFRHIVKQVGQVHKRKDRELKKVLVAKYGRYVYTGDANDTAWLWKDVPSLYALYNESEWIAEMLAALSILPDTVPAEARELLKKFGFIQ